MRSLASDKIVFFTTLFLLMAVTVFATTPDAAAPPLVAAAKKGDIAAVRSILAKGSPPDVRDKNGRTPLMAAAIEGNIQVTDALLTAGADPWAKDNEGRTALYFAAGECNVEPFALLLEKTGFSMPPEHDPKDCDAIAAKIEDILRTNKKSTVTAMLQPALADTYCAQAVNAAKTGKRKEAISRYEATLALHPGLTLADRADALDYLGALYMDIGRYSKAIPLFQETLSILKRIGHVDSIAYADTTNSMGEAYQKMGSYAEALRAYREVLEIIKNKLGETNRKYALTLSDLGTLYRNTGEYDKAFPVYRQALSILQKLGQDGTPRYALIADSLAGLYEETGDYAKALTLYKTALDIQKRTKGDDLGYARALNNLAGLYWVMGDYDKTLTFYLKAKQIVGKALGKRHPVYATALNNLAILYKNVGAFDQALPLYRQSMEVIRETLGENHPNYGGTLNNLAGLYKAMGEYSKALPLYEQAAEVFKRVLGENHPYYAITLLNIATLETELQQYDKALPIFVKSEELLGKNLGKNHPYYGRALSARAYMLFEKGDYANSLSLFRTAAPVVESGGNLDWVGILNVKMAGVLAALKQYKEALAAYEKGLACLEKARSQVGTSALKKSFQNKNYEAYMEAASFMLDRGFQEKAFKVVEEMKARGFLDQLAEGLAKVESGLAPEIRAERSRLLARLTSIDKAKRKAAAKHDGEALASAETQRATVESGLEELELRIRRGNPRYAAIRYPNPVSVRDLMRKTLGPREVLLEYVLQEPSAWVFAVTRERFSAVKLPASSSNIGRSVSMFVEAASMPVETGKHPTEALVNLSRSLYSKLVLPVKDRIAGHRTIIIIPDGKLAFLPFESLVVSRKRSGKLEYLLQNHLVKYFQSATVLALLRTEESDKKTYGGFLGMGDPVYNYKDFVAGRDAGSEGVGETANGETIADEESATIYDMPFQRLPETSTEVRTIARIFTDRALPATVFLRENAREEIVEGERAKDFGYLHFACHGVLDGGFQGLALSRIPGFGEDGFLTIGEIMASDWNSRLTVLSACKTGRGTLERGEGVTGLTRAVMYAGSRAAVVSLWNVNDEATRKFMVYFYTGLLKKKLDAATALRRAKQKMLGKKGRSAPFFWAPFVMYGE